MTKKRKERSAGGPISVAVSLGAALLCGLLLYYSAAVRVGVAAGLRACADVIIPSLYLFMAVAGFIAKSQAGGILSRPFAPLARHVFKLPECMGAVIVLSFLGGYPVGAKLIADLLDENRITPRQAERAVCFCCNAGPSFVVTAIGAHMLGGTLYGAVLLTAHILCALLLGAALSLREKTPAPASRGIKALPFPDAFVAGVNSATTGIAGICAFVVFFSAIGALLEASGVLTAISGAVSGLFGPVSPQAVGAVLIGLLEVTSGCAAAAKLPGTQPFALLPVLLSFAGFSILFQVRGCLARHPLRWGKFYICRVLHAAGTLLLAYPVLVRLPGAAMAFDSAVRPVRYTTPNTPLNSVLLLALCAMVLWALTPLRNNSPMKKKPASQPPAGQQRLQ